ncbi:hypothetical protein KW784_02075 [Candidatus Parcubacteria bacterium]|nr:hypothetical protein [Candidatus Parcubacteria bacterium]
MIYDFKSLVTFAMGIINSLTVLAAAAALFVFFKGLLSFISKAGAGDAKSHAEGRSLMIWGIVGLFVLASVFGILRFFYSDLGFGSVRSFGLPLFQPIT